MTGGLVLAVGLGLMLGWRRHRAAVARASIPSFYARALRLLPTYTLYPATLKDPVLEGPAWGVLAGIFGAALFVAVVCYILAIFTFRSLPRPDFHVSKLTLLAFLLIGIVFSFIYNPYWASLFFVLPAWIWTLAGHGKTLSRRVLNRALILAAGMIYCAVLWMSISRLGMGWNFVWYQVLALSNGLFTKTAYFLATAVIAIGIRFLAIQVEGHRSQVTSQKT